MSETALTSEIDRIQAQFMPLLELDEDAYNDAAQAFVQTRIEQLEATAERDVRLTIEGARGNFQGYLGPDAVIDPNVRGRGYRLDDASIYGSLPVLMRGIYQQILPQLGGDQKRAYLNAVYRTAQHAQQQYFGSVEGNVAQHNRVVADIPGEPELASIADFGTSALCSQRAAFANNVLHVFGVNPVLENGKIQAETSETPADHAYLFVPTTTGNEMIYDPTNPHLALDDEGKLLATEPAFFPVGDALSRRDADTAIVGQHWVEKPVDGQLQRTTQRLNYFLSPNGAELHPI